MSTMSWLEWIRRVDKDFERDRNKYPVYTFGARTFQDGAGPYANNAVTTDTSTSEEGT